MHNCIYCTVYISVWHHSGLTPAFIDIRWKEIRLSCKCKTTGLTLATWAATGLRRALLCSPIFKLMVEEYLKFKMGARHVVPNCFRTPVTKSHFLKLCFPEELGLGNNRFYFILRQTFNFIFCCDVRSCEQWTKVWWILLESNTVYVFRC